MSRYGTSGQLGVYFVPTIAAIAAPTATEIAAGHDLSMYVTRDGLKTPATGNTIDASAVGTRFTPMAPGTYGGDALEMTCHRGSKTATDDVAWTTLTRDTQGFVVVARTGWHQSTTTGLGTPQGTPTLADVCEVYPVTVTTQAMSDTAENQTSRFVAQCAITAEPSMNAVVATGS